MPHFCGLPQPKQVVCEDPSVDRDIPAVEDPGDTYIDNIDKSDETAQGEDNHGASSMDWPEPSVQSPHQIAFLNAASIPPHRP